MPAQIEDAATHLRDLLAGAGIDLRDGPAAVLPMFQRFCEEPFESDSDMILWEVGQFSDWLERPDVNGQVDVLAGGHRKSSLVANESPRGHASLRVVRWVSR
jgi:hypothetical protein